MAQKDDYMRECIVIEPMVTETLNGWFYRIRYSDENNITQTIVVKICAALYFNAVRLCKGDKVYVEFWRTGRREPIIYYKW